MGILEKTSAIVGYRSLRLYMVLYMVLSYQIVYGLDKQQEFLTM